MCMKAMYRHEYDRRRLWGDWPFLCETDRDREQTESSVKMYWSLLLLLMRFFLNCSYYVNFGLKILWKEEGLQQNTAFYFVIFFSFIKNEFNEQLILILIFLIEIFSYRSKVFSFLISETIYNHFFLIYKLCAKILFSSLSLFIWF
jgi:hypothetical protein